MAVAKVIVTGKVDWLLVVTGIVIKIHKFTFYRVYPFIGFFPEH